MSKTTVIYHSADYDGIFCREIARKFLPDAELIGWNFGDAPLSVATPGKIYVLDLPLDAPFGFKWDADVHSHRFVDNDVIWIDHHKTAIETISSTVPGYRIDGVAACRLAWQWFAHSRASGLQTGRLPTKSEFIDRKVEEPIAVMLAGEYDIWDKRDEKVDTFQYGLRTYEPDFKRLLSDDIKISTSEAWKVIDSGYAAQRYADHENESLVKYRSYLIEWEGLKFLTINTARCNSLTFAAKDVPETGHNALMGFYFNGKVWTVSLYHAKHRTDLDLSAIAVKHGGGGHRGACGFTCKTLPFLQCS